MDVVAENIEACRQRLNAYGNIEYHVIGGSGFEPLADGSVSAIFCYDAMVHFSADIIEAYLVDARRVLRPDGRALFHHSNLDAPPDRHFGLNPHARNSMTQARFAALAEKAGLAVLDQHILKWGGVEDLDCITLVERPA